MAKCWGALRNESKENISILWKSTTQGKHSFSRGRFIGVLLIACLADLHPRRNMRADKSPVWPLCYWQGRLLSEVLLLGPCSNSVCSLTFSELYLNDCVCGWRKLIGLSMGGWWAVPMLRRTANRRMGTLDFLILKIIMSHRRASEAVTARRSERLRSEHELRLREGWVSARW